MSQNISNLAVGSLVKDINTTGKYGTGSFVPMIWKVIGINADKTNSVTLESEYVVTQTTYSSDLEGELLTMSKKYMKTTGGSSPQYTSMETKSENKSYIGYTELTGGKLASYRDGTLYSYYSGTTEHRKKSINAQSGDYVLRAIRPYAVLGTAGYPYHFVVKTDNTIDYFTGNDGLSAVTYKAPLICVPSTLQVSNSASGGVYSMVWNTSPVITTPSTNLGDKTKAFTTTFKVTDAEGDTCSGTVKLDGTTIQTLNSITLNTDYTIAIDAGTFRNLSLGSHTILITVTDGTETVTKTISFQKVSGMGISGSDGDLGNIWMTPTIKYQVYDDNDLQVDITEKVDGEITNEIEDAPLNTDITFDLDAQAFDELESEVQHTLKIEAVNADESTAERTWTFTKLYQYLEFYTDTVETDISAERIYVVLDYDKTNNPEIEVWVCNDAGGEASHYEDATEDVLNGQPHTFHYTPAEGTEGVSVMVRLIKNENTERVYFNNIGFTFS